MWGDFYYSDQITNIMTMITAAPIADITPPNIKERRTISVAIILRAIILNYFLFS